MRKFVEIADTVGKRVCKNVLYKVSCKYVLFFQKREFSSELREYSLESHYGRDFHVSVITRTNCRNVKVPGMHGCKADKVTQIQSQIRSSDENVQIFVIFGQSDRSRIT